jgi:hypothetical protein
MFNSLAEEIMKLFLGAALSLGLAIGFLLGAWIF